MKNIPVAGINKAISIIGIIGTISIFIIDYSVPMTFEWSTIFAIILLSAISTSPYILILIYLCLEKSDIRYTHNYILLIGNLIVTLFGIYVWSYYSDPPVKSGQDIMLILVPFPLQVFAMLIIIAISRIFKGLLINLK